MPFVVDMAAESLDDDRHSDEKNYLQLDDDERRHFVTQLSDVFWHLHTTRPVNVLTAPAGMPGAPSAVVFYSSAMLCYLDGSSWFLAWRLH